MVKYIPEQGEVRQFEAMKGYYADSTVIGLFDLAFIQGDPRQALKGINTVVLTAAMAARYFGAEDPLGKVLIYDEDRLLQVTGVVEDMPFNTHLQFDYLISMETFTQVLVEAGYERLLTVRT